MGYYSYHRHSFNSSDIEVQKREIALSVAIFFIMLAIGIMISGKIEDGAADHNAELNKAMHIENIKDFHYNRTIGAGPAFAYFEMKTLSPQSIPEVEGEYLYIERHTEVYTRHIRQVPVYNSKGEFSHFRTEVYYTWDWAESKIHIGDKVLFNEIEMCPSRFGNWPSYTLRMRDNITDMAKESYYNWDSLHIYKNNSVRYYYKVVPLEFSGAVYVTFLNGDIEEARFPLYTDVTPNGLYESKLQDSMVDVVFFWIFWIMLTGGLIFGFIYLDNKWLKDKDEQTNKEETKRSSFRQFRIK